MSKFATQRPLSPIFMNSCRNRRVYLCFVRSFFPPTIVTHDRPPLSDHIPVEVALKFGTASDIQEIPLALLNNRSLCMKEISGYNDSLQALISDIEASTSVGSFEKNIRLFFDAVIKPWVNFSPQKQLRLGPGFTRCLDSRAKRRSLFFTVL